jgi:hypothetical protein
LLWALQLEPATHPSAALSALAQGLDLGACDWLHLDPIHLAAGLSHLSLVELEGELQPTAEQRGALEPLLRRHLRDAGCCLQVLRSGGWLLQWPRLAPVRTVCPAAAAANDLELAMPQGEAGAMLKRLMTELQMLVHEHAVNQQRARQGLPEVNAFWLWGNGQLVPTAARPLPIAFGSNDYLLGLYRYYGGDVQSPPASARELLEAVRGHARALLVLAARSAADFEQEWLVPLVQSLRARRLQQLDLILDGWHLSIDRRGLRRFWRGALPPASWVA